MGHLNIRVVLNLGKHGIGLVKTDNLPSKGSSTLYRNVSTDFIKGAGSLSLLFVKNQMV